MLLIQVCRLKRTLPIPPGQVPSPWAWAQLNIPEGGERVGGWGGVGLAASVFLGLPGHVFQKPVQLAWT